MAGINQVDYDTRGFNIRVAAYPCTGTFSKGELLIWNGSALTSITAATNYAPTTNTTRIAGKVLHDSTYINPAGSSTAFTYAQIEIWQPGTLFPMPLYSATPASAVPALAQLAVAYEVRRSTAVNSVSVPQINLDATTNVAARVSDFVPSKETLDIPNWPVNITGGAQYSLAFAEPVGASCAFSGAR